MTTRMKIKPWTALWQYGQRLGQRLWPDREAMWRFVAPLAFSLGVHAVAGLAIVVLALLLTAPGNAAGGDVMISFDAPEVVERSDAKATSERVRAAAPTSATAVTPSTTSASAFDVRFAATALAH